MTGQNEIAKNVIAAAPAIMSQLMGIVSSLALVPLFSDTGFAKHLSVLWDIGATSDIPHQAVLLAFIQFSTAFLIIVLTWHVYIQNSFVFKRLYGGFTDSLIPFLIAAAEYYVIELSRPQLYSEWEIAVLAYLVLAILSLTHLFTKAKIELTEDNADILRKLSWYPSYIRLYIFIPASVVVLDQFVWIHLPDQDWQRRTAVASVILLTYPVFLFLHQRFFWYRLTRSVPTSTRHLCHNCVP